MQCDGGVAWFGDECHGHCLWIELRCGLYVVFYFFGEGDVVLLGLVVFFLEL